MAEPTIDEALFNEQPAGSEPAGELDQLAAVGYENNANVAAALQVRRRSRGGKYGAMDVTADDAVNARFYVHPLTGKEMVNIKIPGDKFMEYDYVADDRYRRQFAPQYQAFLNQDQQFAGHTMLRDMPWLDEAMRRLLEFHHVLSVEQLASVSDTNVMAIGPGVRPLREKAREYLVGRDQTAVVQGQAAHSQKLAYLESQNAMLQSQLGQLVGMLQQMGVQIPEGPLAPQAPTTGVAQPVDGGPQQQQGVGAAAEQATGGAAQSPSELAQAITA